MRVSDRRLFLRYALPCAETLVKRGDVKKASIDGLILAVSSGRPIPKGAESMFKTAISNCEDTARRMGRKSIGREVIRTYFLVDHRKAVEKRFREKGDFDPLLCNTYVGIVEKVFLRYAAVKTEARLLNYRKDFVKGLKVGDKVVVHRNFIVEKTNKEVERLVR